jgi:hypothetical protein
MSFSDILNPIGIPNLSASRMSGAINSPLKQEIAGALIDARIDNEFFYASSSSYVIVNDTFKVNLQKGATYFFLSESYFDPYNIIVYDNAGTPLIANSESNDLAYGDDNIIDYVATYTGTYYISANWNRGLVSAHQNIYFYVGEDVDTITPVVNTNNAPTSFNTAITTNEDTEKVLNTIDFIFNDVDTGATLSKVMITTLPATGSLKLNATAVTLNQEITASDIISGKLIFTPASNANGTGYSSFGFKVSDGTAYSVTANTVTINVTAINDAPSSANTTETTKEDVAKVLSVANFPFGDVDAGNVFPTIKIASLITAGSLKFNGDSVAINQEIATADIAAGKLVFTPALDASGNNYASFGFKVSDGIIYSTAINTVTFNVTKAISPADVAKLYVATFDRAPDAAGLDYWVNGSGLGIEQIAQSFFDQPETKALYQVGTTNTNFVTSVYSNLFNRTPDVAGKDYWVHELDTGSVAKQNFILAVMNGALDTGVSLDATILNNKMNVGLSYANHGFNNIDLARTVMDHIDATSASYDSAIRILDQNVIVPLGVPDSSTQSLNISIA